MSKSNPLFVDSTKLRGDRIATQIELTDVLLYDDESVFIIIQTSHDGILKIPLRLSDEQTYQAQAWLGHQDTVSYKFVIEKVGTLLFQSTWEEVRAQYAIVVPWKPKQPEDGAGLPAVKASAEDQGVPASVTGRFPESAAKPGLEPHSSTLSSLIDKWGF
jgi:hypothetical protein